MGSKRSGRKSMFEPYKDTIAELLASGCTYQQVVDYLEPQLGSDYSPSSLSYFCSKNGLASRITQGCRDGRVYVPHCDDCDHCTIVDSVDRERKMRLCMDGLFLIAANCYTSPMHCPKRDIEKYCEER